MKHQFTFAIILVILVSISLAAKFERNQKKNEKKSLSAVKDSVVEGGDWNSGFGCPEIQVAVGTSGSYAKEASLVRIYPATFSTENTSLLKIGLKMFTNSALGTNLSSIVYAGATNEYYLGYRYVINNASYTNPTGSNKYIEFQVVNNDNKVLKVKILLPYSYWSYYINDTQGNSIANHISQKRISARSDVVTAKAGASSAANSYCTNKPLLTVEEAGSADTAKQIADLKAKLQTLNSEITTAETTCTGLANTAAIKQTAAQVLQTELDQLKLDSNSLIREINNNEYRLAEYKNATLTTQQTAAAYQAKVDENGNLFNTEVVVLKKEAPNKEPVINTVVELNTKLNVDGVKTEVKKISP